MIPAIAAVSRLALILTLAIVCGGEAQAQKKVRFAYPSSADMGDIPSLLAWEQLKKQGIEVVPTFSWQLDADRALGAGRRHVTAPPPPVSCRYPWQARTAAGGAPHG